jgi:hypothetical protein
MIGWGKGVLDVNVSYSSQTLVEIAIASRLIMYCTL